jgi:hypothetical protein
MPDRVDAVEDADEPAHRDAPIDPVVTYAETVKLPARDDALLCAGQGDHAPLHSTWALFSSHRDE